MGHLHATRTDDGSLLAGVAIAVFSSWGRPRGRDHVSSRLCQHLAAAGARVHGLLDGERGPEPTPGLSSMEPLPANLDDFEDWLRRREIRGLVLSECMGRDIGPELIGAARSQGVSSYALVAWEKVQSIPDDLGCYDGVMSGFRAFASRLEELDLHVVPFQWGWRPPAPKPRLAEEEPIPLLHVSGTGGAFRRKASDKVADAFLRLAEDPRFSCRITTQRHFEPEFAATLRDAGVAVDEGNQPSARIAALNRGARVAVLPSRWESIGVQLQEALSCGTPVVTTDGPPMSEFVRNRYEGLLVPSRPGREENVHVATREFEVDDLVETIRLAADRELLEGLESHARSGGPSRVDPEAAAANLANGIAERLQ